MAKLNALYDRFRGLVIVVVPLLVGIMSSIGYQWLSPTQRLEAQAADIRAVNARVDTSEMRLAKHDAVNVAINLKLDLLVDLACEKFTPEQRVVTKRQVQCGGP